MFAAVSLLDPAVRFKGMVGSARGADHVVGPLRVMPFPGDELLPWYRMPYWGTGIYKLY